MHQGEEGNDGGAHLAYLPVAIKANVLVRLDIVSASAGEVSWVQRLIGGSEHDDEEHLARVSWLQDGDLIAEVLNRAQRKLK